MSDCHAHEGHLAHRHAEDAKKRRGTLFIVLWLTAGYFIAELIGYFITGSLALLADSGHMLADIAAVGLSCFAAWLADCPSPPQKTYGYYRIEILAAFFNGLLLTAISVFIIFEAVSRWHNPVIVQGGPMFYIAIGGLVINMISAWLLHRGQSHDLNMRGAYLHVLGDMLGSIGAVTASVLIMAFNWTFADTLVSLLIAILIIFNAVRLVMESVNILLEGSPAHINVDAVRNHLKTLEGVIAVHDLHVWTITSDRHAVSMHVVVDVKDYNPNMVEMLCNELEHKFGLCHVTIQLETEAFAIHDVHC